ncbi:MAG: penicillin-binding protein 2 [Armatimonadota bacterium]|nr:penicillin-binding protein 2 [Armatimonadota bacterium]
MTRRPTGRSRLRLQRARPRAAPSPRRPPVTAAQLQQAVRRRILVLFVLLLFAQGLLLGRLIYIQGTQAGYLQRLALNQQLEAFSLPSQRGRIFDRTGRPLVTNVEAESVFAVPRAIPDARAFARRVAPLLQLDPQEVERRLEPGLYFAWLRRKVSPQMAAALRALRLEGQVGFLREERRAYPNGTLAAHLLGFVGVDNQGLAGVELAYDATLRGHPGKVVTGRDAVGRPLVETQRLAAPPMDGADLVLTIDQVVQHIAERELQKGVQESGAARGTVLAIDPRTGEVLALAAVPSFDPGAFQRVPPQRWVNRPISEVYEPGSTFKVITVAAALDAGRVTLADRFDCPPFLQVGAHRIRDVHRSCTTTQTLTDIIRHSSNVGAAQVAARLGRQTFYDYIRRFGFGTATGIDLPGEAPGIIRPPQEWLGPSLQTIGFGQGISATPLQLLVAASALANGGVLVRPHVVRMVRDREGRLLQAVGTPPGRRVIAAEVAAAALRMMIRVVEDGTGKLAAVPGYVVAGKTGTAQIPAPQGGYFAGRYISSFLGFAPVPHPRLAVLLVLEEPRGAYFGGAVAAPVFRAIVEAALWYLRVPPSASAPLPPSTP